MKGVATAAPLLEVLAGRRPARRPVWFMRQAGRFLPEYRALRAKQTFAELLANAELATEVTLMPMQRFDIDAAILFTDLLVPLEAMGVPLAYTPGPELGWRVRCGSDLARLEDIDVRVKLPVPLETARRVRALLPPDKALIGFVGAPFTLAAYLVEGRGSKDWSELRRLAWQDPALFDDMLARLARSALAFGAALFEAGCDAIQIFDSWAGVAAPAMFQQQVLPHVRRLIAGFQAEHIPVIYFVNGAATHLDCMIASGADCLGVDFKIAAADVHARLPQGLPCQGNLEPQVLFASEATIARETRSIIEAFADRPHVFNLGHGLHPETPVAGVEQVIATIRNEQEAA